MIWQKRMGIKVCLFRSELDTSQRVVQLVGMEGEGVLFKVEVYQERGDDFRGFDFGLIVFGM